MALGFRGSEFSYCIETTILEPVEFEDPGWEWFERRRCYGRAGVTSPYLAASGTPRAKSASRAR